MGRYVKFYRVKESREEEINDIMIVGGLFLNFMFKNWEILVNIY